MVTALLVASQDSTALFPSPTKDKSACCDRLVLVLGPFKTHRTFKSVSSWYTLVTLSAYCYTSILIHAHISPSSSSHPHSHTISSVRTLSLHAISSSFHLYPSSFPHLEQRNNLWSWSSVILFNMCILCSHFLLGCHGLLGIRTCLIQHEMNDVERSHSCCYAISRESLREYHPPTFRCILLRRRRPGISWGVL